MHIKRNVLLTYLAFLLPGLLVYTLIRVVPLLMSFRYSLTNWDGYAVSYDFIGFKNYLDLFNDEAVMQAMKNTLFFGLVNPLLITVLAIPLALLLNSKLRGTSVYRAVFFFPSVPSALIIGYIWLFIFDPTDSGVLNRLLGFFHMDKVLWLADPNLAMLSILFVSVWKAVGWHSCIYIANLQTISGEYYEAAKIDGASAWQRFWNITFPMLAPGMSISLMLILVDSLKIFELPFALTKGGPGYSTTMLTQIIIERGINEHMIGRASAMSMVFIAMIFIISSIQLSISRRREGKLQ